MYPFLPASNVHIPAFLCPTSRSFCPIADHDYLTSEQKSIGEPESRRSFTTKQGARARTWYMLILQAGAVPHFHWRGRYVYRSWLRCTAPMSR